MVKSHLSQHEATATKVVTASEHAALNELRAKKVGADCEDFHPILRSSSANRRESPLMGRVEKLANLPTSEGRTRSEDFQYSRLSARFADSIVSSRSWITETT